MFELTELMEQIRNQGVTSNFAEWWVAVSALRSFLTFVVALVAVVFLNARAKQLITSFDELGTDWLDRKAVQNESGECVIWGLAYHP